MNKNPYLRTLVFLLVLLSLLIYPYINQFPGVSAQENSYYYMPKDAPIYWSGPTNKKAIALTFDDGPDPIYTPKILAVLAKYNVKATFFLVGEQTQRNLALVKKILAAGHEIGSHTMTHPDSNNSTLLLLEKEVLESVRLLERLSQQKIKYMRPPYGQLSPAYFAACQAQGITMIVWSIDSNDWREPPVDKMVEQVISQVQPGSIILLHDGGGTRQNTVDALDQLLPLLKQMKLEPMTLSQMYE